MLRWHKEMQKWLYKCKDYDYDYYYFLERPVGGTKWERAAFGMLVMFYFWHGWVLYGCSSCNKSSNCKPFLAQLSAQFGAIFHRKSWPIIFPSWGEMWIIASKVCVTSAKSQYEKSPYSSHWCWQTQNSTSWPSFLIYLCLKRGLNHHREIRKAKPMPHMKQYFRAHWNSEYFMV